MRHIRLAANDAGAGLRAALPEVYPQAKWQRCVFHFQRNILDAVPRTKREEAAARLKAIHAMESAESSRAKAAEVVAWLREQKLPKAAKILEEGIGETLAFPREHQRSLRTNNMLERIMKEIRRRTRVVGVFPDDRSALMLVCARLRHISTKSWPDSRCYFGHEQTS